MRMRSPFNLDSLFSSVVPFVIAFILGLVAAIIIYNCFSKAKRRNMYIQNPSLLLLHDFLNFKKMWSLWFYKIFYLIVACIVTLFSIVMMFTANLLVGLLILILGNIAVRCAYELLVLYFSIHENLVTITDKVTNRTPEGNTDVSAKEFFGEMGNQIKNQQEKIRVRAESERRTHEQQYGQQGYPPPPPPPMQQQGYPYPQQDQQFETQQTMPPPTAPATGLCAKCGTSLDDSGAFCPNCGTPINS